MENLTLFPLYQTTCFFIPLVAPCTPLLGYDDIIYFQSTGRKVEIVTYDKRIDFYSSMDEIEKQLNKEIFWRIHKSYIINNRYIKEFSATEIELENAIKLPISRTYREEIKKKILQDKMQRRG